MHLSVLEKCSTCEEKRVRVWGVKILWLYGFNNPVGISFHWNRSTIAHGSKDLEPNKQVHAFKQWRSKRSYNFVWNKQIDFNERYIHWACNSRCVSILSLSLSRSFPLFLFIRAMGNKFISRFFIALPNAKANKS